MIRQYVAIFVLCSACLSYTFVPKVELTITNNNPYTLKVHDTLLIGQATLNLPLNVRSRKQRLVTDPVIYETDPVAIAWCKNDGRPPLTIFIITCLFSNNNDVWDVTANIVNKVKNLEADIVNKVKNFEFNYAYAENDIPTSDITNKTLVITWLTPSLGLDIKNAITLYEHGELSLLVKPFTTLN